MFGDGMGNLMAEYDCQAGIRLSYRQYAFEHDNLASGHAKGVDGRVFDQVEFPGIAFELVGQSILSHIGLDGCGDFFTDSQNTGIVDRFA